MASINDFQIGLDVLIGASSGIIGAVGAYVKLKSRLDLTEAKDMEQSKELQDIRDRKKEMNTEIHRRIDSTDAKVAELSKEVTVTGSKLEAKMSEMELRIIKEIQKAIK